MATNKLGYKKYKIELTFDGLNYLLSNCKCLSYIRSNPLTFGSTLWEQIGQVLVQCGGEGSKLWEQLTIQNLTSSSDLSLFHCKLQEYLSKGKSPKCSDLAKAGYCGQCKRNGTPMDIINEYLSTRQPFISHCNSWQPITIKDAREKHLRPQIASLMSNLLPGIYHVDCPNGIGKTQALIEHLPQYGKTVWLVPRHDLGREIVSKFNSLRPNLSVERYLSRQQMAKEQTLINCPHHLMAQYCSNRGIPFNQLYCANCQSNPICQYYQNVQDILIADAVIGVHDHLLWGKVLWDKYNPDILVIDECFATKLRIKQGFYDVDIDYTEQVINTANIDNYVKRNLIKSLRRVRQGRIPVWTRDFWVDHKVKMEIIAEDQRNLQSNSDKRIILSDIQYLSQSNKQCTKTIDGCNGYRYSYIRTAPLPDNIPVIILDSTTTTAQYSKLLGKQVTTIGLGQNRVQHTVKITQFLDGAYPKTGFEDKVGNVLVKKVKDIVSKVQNVVNMKSLNFISHSNIEQDLKSINNSSGLALHFGAVSGLNSLQNADALVVIGFPMVSHNVLVEDASVAFDTGWSDLNKANIVNSATKSWQNLSFYDDKVTVKTVTHQYIDPLVRDYYEIVPKGNYIQALGRIRPFEKSNSPIPRELIIVCNESTGAIPVDNLRLLSDQKLKSSVWKPKGKQIATFEAVKRLVKRKEEVTNKSVKSELDKLRQEALDKGDRDLAKQYDIPRQTVDSHIKDHKEDFIKAVETCNASNISVGVLDPTMFESMIYKLGYSINSQLFDHRPTETLLGLASKYINDISIDLDELQSSEHYKRASLEERLKMVREIFTWVPVVNGIGIKMRFLF